MFIVWALIIMLSVYVAKNTKLEEKSRTTYFVVIAIFTVLNVLSAVI